MIRNLGEPQAMDKLEAYDKVTRAKEQKKNHNLLKFDAYLDIQDPIAHINEKIAHLDEITKGVPLSVLDRDARNPLGRSIQVVTPLMHLSPQPSPLIQSDTEDIREHDSSHVPKGEEVVVEVIEERENIVIIRDH